MTRCFRRLVSGIALADRSTNGASWARNRVPLTKRWCAVRSVHGSLVWRSLLGSARGWACSTNQYGQMMERLVRNGGADSYDIDGLRLGL